MIDFNNNIHFNYIISMINNEEIKSLENFNNTLTFKLTNVICKKIIHSRLDFPKKEINLILYLIMFNITRKAKNEYNNWAFKYTILHLIGIYINGENSDSNLENFNENIIQIAKEIIYEEENESKKKNL